MSIDSAFIHVHALNNGCRYTKFHLAVIPAENGNDGNAG